MISAGEFKKGVTFVMDGQVYVVVEFQHVKPGKGAAFVRTKIRNVISGAVTETTFSPNEKFERAHIDTKEMQYLYADGDLYYFMDLESYEQIPIEYDKVKDALQYLKENDNATIRFFKGEPFEVKAPNFFTLKVTQTEPGFKGDTATGANKPCTVETGAQITVPLFVNEGDTIRVETRTSEYMERV